MKILHTSDWHIGRALYGRKRYDEHEAFLEWLAGVLSSEEIDVLLIAGDVFDNCAPSNRAQELYYRFLRRAADSTCRHIVAVAGNHDSPSFLDAPRELLKTIGIHVIGGVSDSPGDEVLVLRDRENAPELIVCAVPHLRDRDIRTAEAGESVEDKERKLIEGIRDHYAAVAALAETKRGELGRDVPIVATGHLFAAGGKTVEGDGVRDLYVGSLAHVGAEIFPGSFAYLALGHLHSAQRVGDGERIRYSGSPLPMSFAEAGRRKNVCVADLGRPEVFVTLPEVPLFQELERIEGDWDHISPRLRELSEKGASVWLEIVYSGEEVIPDLRGRIDEMIGNTRLEALRVKNARAADRALSRTAETETLDDLDVDEVFERCLAVNEIPGEQARDLRLAYREAVLSLQEEDAKAE